MVGLHSFLATNTCPVSTSRATNVFLTKITNAIGTTNVGIAWSALFGGKGKDIGYGVALDPAGSNVFVTGSASSTNFPIFNVPGIPEPDQFRQERRVRHRVQRRRHEPLFHLPRRQGE